MGFPFKWTTSAVFSAIFALLLYRQRQLYILLVPPTGLPKAYFAYGNASTACKLVTDPVENRFRLCEDMKLLPKVPSQDDGTRNLLLSCDPGRLQWNTVLGVLIDSKPRGDLWIYSYSSSNTDGQLKKVSLSDFPLESTFHSLGIEWFVDPSEDGLRLFITNLGEKRATVEIFYLPYSELALSKLNPVVKHVMTLSHPGIISPNAIAALSPTSFYVTQDHRLPARSFGRLASVAETLIGMPGGWVDLVLFDDSHAKGVVKKVKRVSEYIPFANGIGLAPDGTTVAVASSMQDDVYLFDRPQANVAPSRWSDWLKFRTVVHTPFHPDNLEYAEDGTIYVAGHPHLLSLTPVATSKPGAVSQSWVASIKPAHDIPGRDAPWSSENMQAHFDAHLSDSKAPYPAHLRTTLSHAHVVETIYQSDGSRDVVGAYGGSSGVIVDEENGVVFVTGLYERGLLQCKTNG